MRVGQYDSWAVLELGSMRVGQCASCAVLGVGQYESWAV